MSKEDVRNPFVVEGFDCASFVRSMLSTTGDARVAESFTRLRGSDGREHIGQLPVAAREVQCQLSYRFDGQLGEGALFKASAMEEKWDIYLYSNRLLFCRSWTGTLAFVAEIDCTPTHVRITRLRLSGEGPADELAVRQVDFLIKSHLYRQVVPHPLPRDLPPQEQAVGHYSFAQYGRVCWFGTYDDTLQSPITKHAGT
jgi:hypothetical protein